MIDAINSLVPNAIYTFKDGVLDWQDEREQPTKIMIDNEIIKLNKEYKLNEYSRLREIEYKKLNQDELRYDDFVNNTTIWIDTITLIKIKYPKPNELL